MTSVEQAQDIIKRLEKIRSEIKKLPTRRDIMAKKHRHDAEGDVEELISSLKGYVWDLEELEGQKAAWRALTPSPDAPETFITAC